MAVYNPQDDLMQDEIQVDVVVRLTVRADADLSEVIETMSWDFQHDLIKEKDIVDVFEV